MSEVGWSIPGGLPRGRGPEWILEAQSELLGWGWGASGGVAEVWSAGPHCVSWSPGPGRGTLSPVNLGRNLQIPGARYHVQGSEKSCVRKPAHSSLAGPRLIRPRDPLLHPTLGNRRRWRLGTSPPQP